MFIYSGKLLHTSKKFLSTFTYHPLFLFVSRQKFEATFQGKSLKVKVEEKKHKCLGECEREGIKLWRRMRRKRNVLYCSREDRER